MDETLRRLERAAIAGDLDAAVRLYYELRRRESRQIISHRDGATVEFNERNFRGPLYFRPMSATQIHVFSSTRSVTPDTIPIRINRVPYSINGLFFYHPEVNYWPWLPYDEESVSAALSRAEQIGVELSINNYIYKSRGDTLAIFREDGGGDPTPRAVNVAKEVLSRAVTVWSEQNPELMRVASLSDTNNQIIEVGNQLETFEMRLEELRQRLGHLMIDELRFGG